MKSIVSGLLIIASIGYVRAADYSHLQLGMPALDTIPPGFESLFDDQQSLVDVYYGGRFVVSTVATFNPSIIVFHHPHDIVDDLPDLLVPEIVLHALSGELPTHQDLVCYRSNQVNCGVLYPEVAGVIFDDGQFRVDVFIEPSLLAVRHAHVNRFLPPSSADLSFLQTFSYAFTGSESSLGEDSNLYGLSLLSYQENALDFEWHYVNNEVFQIDQLAAIRNWQGMRYLGGYFQTINDNLRFSAETDLLGARYGTSMDTRDDQRQGAGRQIQVFLQSRGEVAIFKDGRLISAQFYDVGNQIINTSDLPGGAYDIELRITDSGGTRTETQFYVKNSRLPVQGEPLYFIELGRITEQTSDSALPELTGDYLLRGGFNRRVNMNNAWLMGVSTTEHDTVGEMGWFNLSRYYELFLSAAAARYQRYGIGTELYWNFLGYYIRFHYRRIWDEGDVDPSDPPWGAMNLMGDAQEQIMGGFAFPVGAAQVATNVRYLKRPGEKEVMDYTASVSFPLFRTPRSSTVFRLQYNNSEGDNMVLASISWRAARDGFSYQIQPDYYYGEEDGGVRQYPGLNANANWNSRERWSSDVLLGVNTTVNEEVRSYGAGADWGGAYGRARTQVEYIDRDDMEEHWQYNGNLGTSFIVTKEGMVAGGKEQNQAAVIIDLQGNAGKSYFDVLVNGSKRGTAKAGGKTVISLRPFEIYRIRLRAKGQDFVYFNDREYQVTLYPGNVVTLNWESSKVNVVFGRVKDAQGQAIARALITGVEGLSITDEYGFFQAEIKENTSNITVETRTQQCKMVLPAYTTRQGVGSLGTLSCELMDK